MSEPTESPVSDKHDRGWTQPPPERPSPQNPNVGVSAHVWPESPWHADIAERIRTGDITPRILHTWRCESDRRTIAKLITIDGRRAIYRPAADRRDNQTVIAELERERADATRFEREALADGNHDTAAIAARYRDSAARGLAQARAGGLQRPGDVIFTDSHEWGGAMSAACPRCHHPVLIETG